MPPKRSRNAPTTLETVGSLLPNGKNPRLPWKDAEQSNAFAKSLAEFGDLSGVVFNLTTSQLVGGHKRVEAFKASGDPTITRTHLLESPDASGTVAYGFAELASGVRFSYREVRWSEKKEYAALLAANKWSAEWDFHILPDILQSLKGDEFNLSVVGFSDHELKHLLGPTAESVSADTAKREATSSEVSLDDAPEGVTCPRCHLNFVPK